ncbi:MAG: response regulator [Rhodothermaceae bacterium]|nr:response regulator [Rhodothermaceae bacterium]
MSGKNPLILLIEDNPSVIRLLEFKLSKENFRFEHRDNGHDGIEAVKQLRPDIVVLDVMLPGIDGFEVLRQIRQDEQIKDTRVMMLTSKNMEDDLERGFAMGAMEYMSKPFKLGEFMIRLKRILN